VLILQAQQAIDRLSKRLAKEKEDMVARHEAAMLQIMVQQTKEKEQIVKKHQASHPDSLLYCHSAIQSVEVPYTNCQNKQSC
jgi:hypothetical protein